MRPSLKVDEKIRAEGRIGNWVRMRILSVEIQKGFDKRWRSQEFSKRTCSRHDRK